MRTFKIVLSVLFVLTVAFWVAHGLVHRRPIILPEGPPVPVKAVVREGVPPAAKAKMAIILDDWGYSSARLKEAIALRRPVTLSVLPNLPHSRKIAEEAARNRLGVMLHMPMQPREKRSLERNTILTSSGESEIRRFLEEALQSVPHAEGVNNHMGSAATSDERVMRAVLSFLKQRGLFFVDSYVVSQTQGPRLAKEMGLRFQKRDVFIDNQLSLPAIKKELYRARDMAFEKGQVVVIGHDEAPTLRAIREVAPELEKQGIRFVLVKELAE